MQQTHSVDGGLESCVSSSFVLLFRGYTRKEPFENGIFTAKAENWNGRTAMIGFTGIILTEALAGKTVLEVWLFSSGLHVT